MSARARNIHKLQIGVHLDRRRSNASDIGSHLAEAIKYHVLVAGAPADHDDLMNEAVRFSWHQFAVNVATGLDAQLIELGFRPSLDRPPGMAVSIMEMNSDAPHDGEMHPDGDEVIYVLEGRFSVRLGIEDPTYIEVGAGQGIVIPKGVWHKIHILASCRLVTVTPGPRFEYKLPS